MKHYIKGSADFAGLVLETLISYGGNNNDGLKCNNSNYYYTVDNNNNIIDIKASIVETSEMRYYIRGFNPIQVKSIEEACDYSPTVKWIWAELNTPEKALPRTIRKYYLRLILILISKMWRYTSYSYSNYSVMNINDSGDVIIKPIMENNYTGDHVCYEDLIFNNEESMKLFIKTFEGIIHSAYDI